MKTSIVIPIYNVEDIILRCLNSVAAQTVTDFEALLIDDCSKDRSLEIVQDFVNNYHGDITFRIIRQEKNQGQSMARNRGIQEATGDYIYFLDSDDYISEDCIELLSKEMEKDASIQMVIGNYKVCGPQHIDPFLMQQRIYTSEEIIREQLRYNIYTMPWNKLVRKSFLLENSLFFQPGIIHEDNLWTFCSAFCFDKIAVVLRTTYYYIIRQGSTERSHDQDWHISQLFMVFKYLVKFIFESEAPSKKNVKENLEVFRFIEKNMIPLIMEPYIKGNQRLSYRRYCEIRALPYWSWQDIKSMNATYKDKKKFKHFTKSIKKGYLSFIKQNAKYQTPPEMNTTIISVITVNYNNLEGLRRTVPSVCSQTYTGFEFIVVDGGSTDGSKEYLQSVNRIDRWVSEPDKGVYDAMNKAVKMAHGDYCIFMNSGDTFFSPLVLESVERKLRDADFYTGCSTFLDEQTTYTCFPPHLMNIDFLLENSLNHQATFIKTSFLKENPYDETYKMTADWGLFMKSWLLDKCTYECIPDMVAIYYLDGMSTLNKDKTEQERKAQFEVVANLLEESGRKADDVLAIRTYYAKDPKPQSIKMDTFRESNKTLRHKRKLVRSINKAMTMPPLIRDLKIARNAFKMFFKDLF